MLQVAAAVYVIQIELNLGDRLQEAETDHRPALDLVAGIGEHQLEAVVQYIDRRIDRLRPNRRSKAQEGALRAHNCRAEQQQTHRDVPRSVGRNRGHARFPGRTMPAPRTLVGVKELVDDRRQSTADQRADPVERQRGGIEVAA